MRRLIFQTCLFFAAAGLLAISPLHASVVTVYSNFSEDPNSGPGSYPYACPDPACNIYAYSIEWFGQYDWGAGIGVRAYGQGIAMPFTVGGSQDLYLYEVSLPMYKYPDNTPLPRAQTIGENRDNLLIEIVEGTSNNLPSGNVLEVLALNPSIAQDDTTFLDLFSLTHPLLQAGHTYWIVARPASFDPASTNVDTFYGWIENQQGAQFSYTVDQWNFSSNNGNGAWQGFFNQSRSYTAPGLNVFATTDLAQIPEPATFALAGLALIGLAGLRKRR